MKVKICGMTSEEPALFQPSMAQMRLVLSSLKVNGELNLKRLNALFLNCPRILKK